MEFDKVKEDIYIPFSNTDEFYTEYAKRAGKLPIAPIDMPFVYLKSKEHQLSQMIQAYDNCTVIVGGFTYNMNELFNDWTFNDGSPCGVKVD